MKKLFIIGGMGAGKSTARKALVDEGLPYIDLDEVGHEVLKWDTVKEELAANEPSVIISRRPCALLKYVKHQAPLAVDTDKCVGCKSCMRIGCPAISMKEGKAHVDNPLCVGCGVCEQMCAFGAFQSTEKEG